MVSVDPPISGVPIGCNGLTTLSAGIASGDDSGHQMELTAKPSVSTEESTGTDKPARVAKHQVYVSLTFLFSKRWEHDRHYLGTRPYGVAGCQL